ncbi:MAG: hypothetical protein MRJ96_06960 [Nitrospirales bacterium]|nr:hypothetical protein [Nitrospirales bacterium]
MTKLNNNDGDSRRDASVLEGASKNVWRQLYELDRRVARLQRLGDLKGADPDLTQKEAEILPMLLERR